MRVSQLKHGEIEMLDSLEYPVFFGHEVFTTGRISFESLRQLSSILTKFTTALDGYNCKNVRVVSSTVMREAENRSFVIDQLKIHNNLHLEILEYSEEKALICSEIIRLLKRRKQARDERRAHRVCRHGQHRRCAVRRQGNLHLAEHPHRLLKAARCPRCAQPRVRRFLPSGRRISRHHFKPRRYSEKRHSQHHFDGFRSGACRLRVRRRKKRRPLHHLRKENARGV